MAFSMKRSRAFTGMLSHESNAFKFSKTAKNTNSTNITCTIVPGLVELFYLGKGCCQLTGSSDFNVNSLLAVRLLFKF